MTFQNLSLHRSELERSIYLLVPLASPEQADGLLHELALGYPSSQPRVGLSLPWGSSPHDRPWESIIDVYDNVRFRKQLPQAMDPPSHLRSASG